MAEAKFKIEIDDKQLKDAEQRVKQSFSNMTKAAENEGSKIDAVFKKLGAAVAGYFSIQAASAFVRQLVSVRQQIESLNISFATLLGSQEKSAALMKELSTYAAKTPLQLEDLAKGAQTLLSFNVEAEQVMPTLKAIGDISMGDSQKLQSLTLAFSQMSSTGKLMGQDLLQMINAGFNPLTEISKETGKSVAVLKDEMSKGAISADMVAKAFMSATSEGGKFYGMLDKQSKGIAGSFSNLQGAIKDMMNNIGEQINEPLVNATNSLTEIVKNYKELGKIIADIVAVYGSYKAAVIAYNAAVVVSTNITKGYTIAQQAQLAGMMLLEKAQALLNKTVMKNPYAIAAAALVAMSIAIYKVLTHMTATEKAFKDFNREVEKQQGMIQASVDKYDVMVRRLNAAKKGTEEYKVALKDINSEFGDYITKLGIQTEEIERSADAQRKLRDAIRQAAQEQAKSVLRQTADQQFSELYAEGLEELKKQLKKAYGENTNDYFKALNDIYSALNDGLKDSRTIKSDLIMKGIESDKNRDNVFEAIQRLIDSKQNYQNELNIISNIIDKGEVGAQTELEVLQKALAMAEDPTEKKEILAKIKKLQAEERKKTEPQKDKAYWEEQVKKLTGEYEALVAQGAAQKELLNKQKEIEKAQANLDKFSPKIAIKNDKKELTEEEKKKNAIIKAKNDADKAEREATVASMQQQIELAKQELELMEDNNQKFIDQIDLEYDQRMLEIEKKKNEYLEKNRDDAERKYTIEHPNVKIEFDRTSINTFTQEQQNTLKQMKEFADKAKQYSLDKILQNTLSEFPTVLKRWTDIEKKYSEIRKTLYDDEGNFRNGVTKETLDNIDKAEKEEMRRMFSDINSDNVGFKNFLGTLENYTLKQLETMIEKVRTKFEELSSDPDADVKITAQYGELLYVLEELIKKKKQFAELSIAGNSEELKKLTSTARELADALNFDSDSQEFLNNLLDVFEDVADIATEISNTMQDVANIASDVTDEVAETTSSIADSRDWITLVIKLVIKLVSWIVKATDKVKQTKELLDNTLTEHIEPALSNIDLNLSNIELYSSIGDIQQAVYSLMLTLDKLRGTYNSMSGYGEDAALDMDLLHDKVLYLSNSILDLYHSNNMLGSSDPYENQINSLNNYSYQIQVLTAKLNAYRAALSSITESDKNAEERTSIQQAINQIEGEIASALSSSFDTITDIIEGKLSISFEGMAEQLANTLWEAFDSGADAAQAWADTVDDIIKNMTRKLIMESIILKPLKEILNRLTGDWVTVDNEGKYHIDQEAITNSLPSLQQELMGLYEDVMVAYEGLEPVLKGFAKFGEDAAEATSKGIAQASQESIDELNGRMTVIQAHTAQLLENSGIMRIDITSIRSLVGDISSDTSAMRSMMSGIQDNVQYIRNNM